ncbi:MAG: polysaccharide deacetylase family protein [Pseudolabrys sp.]
MTPLKAAIGDAIAAAYAVGGLRAAAAGCRVLMYHAVGGAVAGDTQQLYSLAPDLFARHVGVLKRHAVVSLSEGIARGEGLAVTFDDGYRDNLTVAAPLLVEAGVPFTVFVVPTFVESGAPQYLSRSEVVALARLPGVTIGAHGYSHTRLTTCDDGALARELTDSRAWLEDLLGAPVTTMSYPHGAVDDRVATAAAAAGFTLAACSRFGSHRIGGDCYRVPRTDIWSFDGARRLQSKIAGQWDWMAWR